MSNELRLRLYEAEDELYGLKLTIASMGKERDKQIRRIRELESENERLHDLVRDMYAAFVHGNCYRWCEFKEPCNYISDGKCQWYDRMCELGAEVVE